MTSHRIRSALPEDYPAYARLFVELGVPDPVPSQGDWDRDYSKRAIVLELDGAVVSYGIWSVYGELGHVSNVVVDPTHRGQRLGEGMMREMATRLRALGCKRWMLNVKEANASAIRLYERLGFKVTARSYATMAPWSVFAKLEPSSDFTVRALQPEEEGPAEKHFGLADGALTNRRKLSPLNQVLGAFDRDHAIQAVALFMPKNSGVNPIRVTRFEAVANLFGPILAARLPESEQGRVFVEDNEALRILFENAGVNVLFSILKMEGEFPDQAVSETDPHHRGASNH